MNDGTGPVEERFYPRIWRRAIATGVVTEIDGAEALKRLPAGQDLWMRVDGRTPKPAAQKLNPLWWAVNDWDKLPPDWSLPGKPEWLRAFNWWWRNPFHSGGRYVLGVGDRNYWVHITRRDGYKALTNREGFSYQDLYGWEIGEIILNDGAALPWFAYGSDTAVFYAGWQPTGFAGIKFNRRALWFSPTLPLLFLAMLGSRALAALCPPKQGVRGWGSIADVHSANASDEHLTIGSITVTDEITWSLVSSAGLSELPGDPILRWMAVAPSHRSLRGLGLIRH